MRASGTISTDARGKAVFPAAVSTKRFLSVCLCVGLLGLCANANKNTLTPSLTSDGNKTELRNNAASLLADLLGQEKMLAKS